MTWQVMVKWYGADLDSVEIECIEPEPIETIDAFDSVHEQIMEKVIEHMDEIVASGYNEDDRGW